jgi:hypothetical protein
MYSWRSRPPRNKSTTFDEIQHLTLGYLYWTQPSNHLAPENGIFAQAWAALPLLADHLKAPQETGAQRSNLGHWGEYYRFFYAMGNDPSAMLFQARTMISLLGATLGALIFFWSRELFGAWGGLVSLLLFIFCPNMLANGALVTADMAATLGFFAATLQLAYDFQFYSWSQETARLQILLSPNFSLWSSTGMKAYLLEILNAAKLLPPAYLEGLS